MAFVEVGLVEKEEHSVEGMRKKTLKTMSGRTNNLNVVKLINFVKLDVASGTIKTRRGSFGDVIPRMRMNSWKKANSMKSRRNSNSRNSRNLNQPSVSSGLVQTHVQQNPTQQGGGDETNNLH